MVFNPTAGFADLKVEVPCGQCIGCRLERSRQWAVRCMHEAQMYKENCFVTLTYRDAPVSLDKRHFQLFMKRLRKFFRGERISYFHCGEYGGELGRPHYHALLFGVDFPDRRARYQGSDLYTSATLDRLWGHGMCMIGEVTFASAAYVARYALKKVTGDKAVDHYAHITEDGEVIFRQPEYATMSRRPAIGARWFHAYGEEVVRADSIVANGVESKPPRFYDKLLEVLDAKRARATKGKRAAARKTPKARANSTRERLAVREEVTKARVNQLRRGLT